jgi:hypothetical protein
MKQLNTKCYHTLSKSLLTSGREMNRVAKTLLNVMRIEVLLGIGLVLWVTALSGCSSVNHLDAAVMGYEYVDSRVIGDEPYEVFQSEKQSDFYRAAIIQEGFCCVIDPRRWVNNVKVIEEVTQCKVDSNFVNHSGLLTEARVVCPSD